MLSKIFNKTKFIQIIDNYSFEGDFVRVEVDWPHCRSTYNIEIKNLVGRKYLSKEGYTLLFQVTQKFLFFPNKYKVLVIPPKRIKKEILDNLRKKSREEILDLFKGV